MSTGSWSGRRAGLLLLGLVVAGLVVFFVGEHLDTDEHATGSPRFVLLLSIDTLRADHVGPGADGRSATPELDKLGTVSHRFTQAKSPIPLTLPSHGSMLTGLYPVHHGSHDNGEDLDEVPALPELLRAAGWKTAGFIAAAVLDGRFGLARGFDTYDDGWISSESTQGVAQRGCEQVNRAALRWLSDGDDGAPKFLFVHYFEPHRDYVPPSPFKERFAGDPYRGEVAYADHCAGTLLGALAERDLLHEALVIVTSDHGEGLGEHDEVTHGLLNYESTQHVPLLIKPAGSTQASVDERFVSLVDIAPTVLGALGLQPERPMEGIDLFATPTAAPRTLWAESRVALEWGATPTAVAYRDPLKYIDGVRPELYDIRADSKEEQSLADTRPEDTKALAAALREAGIVEAMHTPSDATLDDQTREMLLALGYVRDDADTAPTAEPIDARDIAYAHYRYAGMKGTVTYQGKLPPADRDVNLIRAVAEEAERLHAELPGVDILASVAANARQLLE